MPWSTVLLFLVLPQPLLSHTAVDGGLTVHFTDPLFDQRLTISANSAFALTLPCCPSSYSLSAQ